MLEKIQLINFQKHHRLEIEFDPNITTIVGDNEAGKTTVIRALRWITHNRPSGEGFHTIGKHKTRVKVFLDGRFATRTKSKTRNTYQLDDKSFKAFGQKVPDTVQSFLDIGDVNYQLQHDPFFWISSSPGQIAKELNEIINLSKIDSSLAYVSSGLRKSKSKAEVIQERLKQSRERKKELSWVTAASIDLQAIESLENQALEATQDASALASLITRCSEHQGREKTLGRKLRDSQQILSIADDLLEVSNNIESLEKSISRIESLNIKSSKLNHAAKSAEQKLHAQLKDSKCPICHRPM